MEAQRRILIADDEETFLRATAALFRREGYLCDAVRDAAAGLRAAEQGVFDVMVADINMVGNRELEFVREIRSRFAQLPVILVTGYPSIGTAIEALRLSAVDYILKPVDFPELLRRVDDAVERGRTMRLVAQHLEQLSGCIGKLQGYVPAGIGVAAGAAPSGPPRLGLEASPEPGARPAFRELAEKLSRREREILEAVAAGQRVASIARLFRISPHTVRNHLKAIFRKVGVHSQVELLGQFHTQNLASLPLSGRPE